MAIRLQNRISGEIVELVERLDGPHALVRKTFDHGGAIVERVNLGHFDELAEEPTTDGDDAGEVQT